jgi:hypothetical protein
MPWWGWLAVSVLGVIALGLSVALGYLVHMLMHMFDGM